MTKEQTTRAPCNECQQETKHFVIVRHSNAFKIDFSSLGLGEVDFLDTYELLECCGCEGVMLRHSSESSDPSSNSEIKYYPPRLARTWPKWAFRLPEQVASLVSEVYAALHADSRSLALMGARTLIDLLTSDKLGDKGSFEQKLESLEKEGYVGRRNREFLTVALDAGSAAAHRGYRPSEEEVGHVMDIVENLLQAVYVLEGAARSLESKVPKRKKSRAEA